MATTQMGTSNPLTVKLWSKKGFIDMYKNSWFGHAASRGSLFQDDMLSNVRLNSPGDSITYNFTGILLGEGVGEGGALENNEEALDLHSDSITINVVRQGVNNPNMQTIEQQRTHVNFENRARVLLPKWHMSRVDASFFNQLAGVDSTTITVDGTTYTGAKKRFVQGNNAVSAPSTNRIVRAGAAANDESLTVTDTMKLDLVDAARELAATTQNTIETLDGDEYDLYCSPEQIVDLKRDTTGKIQWYTNEIAVIQGGKTDNNNIMNHYLKKPIGRYANVNIYECTRIPNGVNSGDSSVVGNTKRAVLVGRNAGVFASPMGGRLSDENVPFEFFTQLKDYGYYKGIEARMIYGLKKLVFNNEDYGSIVISTYAAPHTS